MGLFRARFRLLSEVDYQSLSISKWNRERKFSRPIGSNKPRTDPSHPLR
jgi:hypothetical protein